jgi:hypothetical protein
VNGETAVKAQIIGLLTLLALLLPGGCTASAPDRRMNSGAAGIVYGEGHAFCVAAPHRWVLDNHSGADQGLHAVFYPVGSSWADAPAVMYATAANRRAGESLDEFIAGDLAEYKNKSPNAIMAAAAPIETSDKKQAVIRHFTGDAWGNKEAVAYIQEDTVFVIITLTARTAASYESALPAFTELVKSYYFLTKDVQINAK